MERIPEPELMDGVEQALAYTQADFSASHGRRVEIFREAFPGQDIKGQVLDLGCGSGDVMFRFGRAFPRCAILGVDGSHAMLELAEEALRAEPELRARITLLEGLLPGAEIPRQPYELIMSHSFLHHLHCPETLWQIIADHSAPGTLVFVADLRRPASEAEAQRTIDRVAANEPEILRRDFYNSLCAAFEPEEIAAQLRQAGLDELRIRPVSDIHLIVYGVRAGARETCRSTEFS